MVTPAATSARCLNKKYCRSQSRHYPCDKVEEYVTKCANLGFDIVEISSAFLAINTDGAFASVTERFVPLLPRLGEAIYG